MKQMLHSWDFFPESKVALGKNPLYLNSNFVIILPLKICKKQTNLLVGYFRKMSLTDQNFKNLTIYNILGWFAELLGQMTCQPGHSKLFVLFL